ncbi:hypothetical protein D9619_010655 [Psilocybe cf. subviscida]|uniref:Uncharacterized protein n=1 Tax=Psilocybe cf. subviscida TaxID=2480587 RepID=A0A8H5B8P0_9AGAR|nr:hypothetical protein D9619_010655 [Psilocybe cf. subviscida]
MQVTSLLCSIISCQYVKEGQTARKARRRRAQGEAHGVADPHDHHGPVFPSPHRLCLFMWCSDPSSSRLPFVAYHPPHWPPLDRAQVLRKSAVSPPSLSHRSSSANDAPSRAVAMWIHPPARLVPSHSSVGNICAHVCNNEAPKLCPKDLHHSRARLRADIQDSARDGVVGGNKEETRAAGYPKGASPSSGLAGDIDDAGYRPLSTRGGGGRSSFLRAATPSGPCPKPASVSPSPGRRQRRSPAYTQSLVTDGYVVDMFTLHSNPTLDSSPASTPSIPIASPPFRHCRLQFVVAITAYPRTFARSLHPGFAVVRHEDLGWQQLTPAVAEGKERVRATVSLLELAHGLSSGLSCPALLATVPAQPVEPAAHRRVQPIPAHMSANEPLLIKLLLG